jgi:ribosomal protein S18 acetylase RimI-like enzyme
MQVRSLGYGTDLMVRRLAGSAIAGGDDRLVVRTPANPTFYWGNFLLVASRMGAGDGGRWLEVFRTAFPFARHVSIGVDVVDGDPGDLTELESAGVAAEEAAVLTASGLPPPEHRAPMVVCRHLESDDDWDGWWRLRVAVAAEDGETTEGHRLFLRRTAEEARALVGAGHAAWFGAFVDGVLSSGLGIVSNAEGVARYQTVETRPDARRRGLAGALVHAAGEHAVRERGARRLVIVADPDGPAIGLYRSLGFTEVERQVQLLRPPPSTP